MTIAEMHDLCDLLIDKANAPWFNPVEKDRFLNLASMEFVETRYGQFEFNEKRREELSTLVRTSIFGSVTQINLSAISDFMFVLALWGSWTDVCEPSGLRLESIGPIQMDQYAESQRDPFNKNDDRNPGYLQSNSGTATLLDIISQTPPQDLRLIYLKIPATVSLSGNVNSDLPAPAHEEIVNIAVRKMLMTVKDQNYQIQLNEINNQE